MNLSYSSPAELGIIFLAGVVASGINAVAGGGSLVSFPVLTVGTGIPALPANATNSVGLWPGSLASAFGFKGVAGQVARWLRILTVPTIAGSIIGAFLLSSTSHRVFELLVPGLIFLATLLLALQPKVKEFVSKTELAPHPAWAATLQLLVSVYGGYFGAGMGIMMLGTLALCMHGSIHEMNAVKNWLAVIINIAATVVFIAQGIVVPLAALALAVGGILGGYAAARLSLRADSEPLRKGIVVYGFTMAGFFAWRAL